MTLIIAIILFKISIKIVFSVLISNKSKSSNNKFLVINKLITINNPILIEHSNLRNA